MWKIKLVLHQVGFWSPWTSEKEDKKYGASEKTKYEAEFIETRESGRERETIPGQSVTLTFLSLSQSSGTKI